MLFRSLWHLRHFQNPREVNAKSIMPAYTHLITNDIDFDVIQKRVDGMAMLGVPYGEAVNKAPDMARAQAKDIAADLKATGGGDGFETKEVTALIAYVQRLGMDIKTPAVAKGASAPVPTHATASAPSVAPSGGHP